MDIEPKACIILIHLNTDDMYESNLKHRHGLSFVDRHIAVTEYLTLFKFLTLKMLLYEGTNRIKPK
jgi:hypothetical protein